jgi:hypothetical protein
MILLLLLFFFLLPLWQGRKIVVHFIVVLVGKFIHSRKLFSRKNKVGQNSRPKKYGEKRKPQHKEEKCAAHTYH